MKGDVTCSPVSESSLSYGTIGKAMRGAYVIPRNSCKLPDV
jgi:hypothetical protein